MMEVCGGRATSLQPPLQWAQRVRTSLMRHSSRTKGALVAGSTAIDRLYPIVSSCGHGGTDRKKLSRGVRGPLHFEDRPREARAARLSQV